MSFSFFLLIAVKFRLYEPWVCTVLQGALGGLINGARLISSTYQTYNWNKEKHFEMSYSNVMEIRF